MFLGFALIIFFGLNMFFFWTMNDGLWLASLFLGLIAFFGGVWIDYYHQRPMTMWGWEKRAKQIQSARNVVILSSVLLICICLPVIMKMI